jgi:F-type H+-transporting ATPase subunit beta
MSTTTANTTGKGRVTQVVGVVVDVEFDGELPAIYDALTFQLNGATVYLEVAQHLSENSIRAVALGGTDGLTRGTEVTATGSPVQVPIGPETQGRMFNVVGDPIDGKPAPKGERASKTQSTKVLFTSSMGISTKTPTRVT